nr:glycosyltransferase family 4 protein [Brachyspira aalborgi]
MGKFVYILAREVAKLGHQVHVITLTRDNIERVDFEENVWVHRIKVNNYPKSLLEYNTVNDNFNQNRMNTLYSHYEEILKINKKCKVDVVQTPIWDSLGFYALFDTRFNLVTTLHTSLKTVYEGIYHINEEVEFHIEIEEYLLNKNKFIVSNSKAIEKQYNQYYNDACEGKTFLIPHGLEDISKLVKKHDKKLSDNIEILFVGRLEHRKGIDIIFECIPYICQKYNNVIFRFSGDDTINMPNSEKTYKDYFLSKYNEFKDRVIFEGYISDEEIINRYSNCDIFIAPSRFESFGLIFLEAMIFSKPVIGTNVSGIPEAVSDGVSGILIEDENSEDLKNALIKLIENKDIRESMGKNGRRIYEEKFTAEIMANKFIDYYKNILKCRS